MSKRHQTESQLLSVYQKVNPSTYQIDTDDEEFRNREAFFSGLLHQRLCFPKKMFRDADLIEFGSGTGEHSLFYLLWGARGTFVEINEQAIERMTSLFQHFQVPGSQYQAINQSIFDFEPDRTWEFVATMGVLHHLEDKEQAFERVARCVSQDGFLLLGVGNKAGMFQRNLQRMVVNHFAGQDHERIERVAEQFFPEHLDRAERFGRRSRQAIIYDTYVNPKIDSMSVREIMTLFHANNLRLYSAWPPVMPAILGDSPNRPMPNPLDWADLFGIVELAWIAHQEDDAETLPVINEDVSHAIESLSGVIDRVNDQNVDEPMRPAELAAPVIEAREAISRMADPYRSVIERTAILLDEVGVLSTLLAQGSVEKVSQHLQSCKVLFRGTAGLGMNYFIGQRPPGPCVLTPKCSGSL